MAPSRLRSLRLITSVLAPDPSQVGRHQYRALPDFAALHPGYDSFLWLAARTVDDGLEFPARDRNVCAESLW